MQRRKIEDSKGNSVNQRDSTHIDTQVKAVKPRALRRKFSNSEKLKMLQAYDACPDVAERGEYLRKQGLYYASITKWRQLFSDKSSKKAGLKSYKLSLEHNQVLRENATLKKKLAQAEAIIDLQKKVSELLSVHVLKPEMSEE